jgi:hypothetical protein
MTAKKKYISSLIFGLFFVLSIPLKASAVDIPLLTWERGKEQNIIMGGQTQSSHWDLFLVGQSTKPLKFTPSIPNAKGFIVFSVSLPLDLPEGAYSVQASAPGNPSTVVAGVRITPRAYYAISQIPTDLRVLVILYAILISSFSVIRSSKYRKLSFETLNQEEANVPDWVEPLKQFRVRRISSLGTSFMKYIAMMDGARLNRLSPTLWSLSPFIGLGLGIFSALKIQGHSVVPDLPIWLIIVIGLAGALDAVAGIATAIGFTAIQIGFGDINSIRSLLILIAFTFAWYAPAMLSSMYLLTIPNDFKSLSTKVSSRTSAILTNIFAALFGSIAVVISAILTDSLVISKQGSVISRYPLAAIIFIAIIAKNSISGGITKKSTDEEPKPMEVIEELELARVVSPGFATIFTLLIVGLIDVWTQSWTPTFIATGLIGTPLFLLFMVFPEFASKRLPKIERNVLVEALVVGILTVITYLLIQMLPMGVVQKSKTFILLGVIPVLLHAVYSLALASKERAEEREVEKYKEVESE